MRILQTISTAAILATLTLSAAEAQASPKAKAKSDKAPPGANAKVKQGNANDARRAATVIDVRQADPGARGRAASPARGGTPPGLAKKGGLPPGQAKKIYRTDDGMWTLRDVMRRRGYTVTRLSRSNDVRYVYYRTPDGTIRRAAVRPGAERLSFENVPAVVLREVIARLY